jgi:predicted RNase H-like nuclease (RuvC/YqgF family)
VSSEGGARREQAHERERRRLWNLVNAAEKQVYELECELSAARQENERLRSQMAEVQEGSYP